MSTLRAATIADLAGTGPATLTGQWAKKSWIRFNGTGTVAVNASGNTSSLTDNGAGDFSSNFTTAMSDANFECQVSFGNSDGTQAGGIYNGTLRQLTVSLARVNFRDTSGAQNDWPAIAVGVVR